MSQFEPHFDKVILANALQWFLPDFRQKLVTALESQFPNYPLAREVQEVLRGTGELLRQVQGWPGEPMSAAQVGERLTEADMDHRRLFKQILLSYRRWRAAECERLTEIVTCYRVSCRPSKPTFSTTATRTDRAATSTSF